MLGEGLSIDESVKIMIDAGFESFFTGMSDESRMDEFANAFAKNGVLYETIHAPFAGINEIWLDSEGGEKIYQDMITCIDRCKKLDVPTMIIHMSSGVTPPPVTDLGRDRYDRIIDYAQKNGVLLAFENLRKLAHLAWVFEHYKDHETVKMCWDCGHETCYTPQYEFMPMFGERVVALHIHDNYGILNQDDHLLPFDGVTDFARVGRQIKESGYEGSIMLEIGQNKREDYKEMGFEAFVAKAADAAKRIRVLTDGE